MMFGSLVWTREFEILLKPIAYLRCTVYISSTATDHTMFVFFSSQVLRCPHDSCLLYISIWQSIAPSFVDQVVRQPTLSFHQGPAKQHLLRTLSYIALSSHPPYSIPSAQSTLLEIQSISTVVSSLASIVNMCRYDMVTYMGCRHKEIYYSRGCPRSYHELMRIYDPTETGIPFDWPDECQPEVGKNVVRAWSRGLCNPCRTAHGRTPHGGPVGGHWL